MSNQGQKHKVLVILGTTASGKTGLGVALARQFDGEIVSADSRQVYRGLNVGSGKDLQKYGNIKYHLIGIADPKEIFSVAEYQKKAFAAIDDILQRGKLPIIVGGSGQYLEAVVENYQLSDIKPDMAVRAENENRDAEELFAELKLKNLAFALKLNNSDKNNKRRLIRYLEVVNHPKPGVQSQKPGALPYDFLLLSLTWPKEVLAERIHRRLIERLEKEGLIQEVSDLNDKTGLSWERLESFGLEYKFIARYLQEKIDYEQMAELLERAINQFAKKQMTWFKRWGKKRKINWLIDKGEAKKMVKDFLGK